jgi:Flp pilus assembly protein TadG
MLVEAALVLTILITLTFGLIEYGWIFYKVQQINNAARHGARIGALYKMTNNDAEAAVNDLMTDANISGYSVTFSPVDISSMDSGETLTVTVSVPCSKAAKTLLVDVPLIPVPETLEASVSMAKEGI